MTQIINSEKKPNQYSRQASNLLNRILVLEHYLEGIDNEIRDLNREADNVNREKKNIEEYLTEKCNQTNGKLFSELSIFQNQIKKSALKSKNEIEKLDLSIKCIKDIQTKTIQMVQTVRRRTQQLQAQLG